MLRHKVRVLPPSAARAHTLISTPCPFFFVLYSPTSSIRTAAANAVQAHPQAHLRASSNPNSRARSTPSRRSASRPANDPSRGPASPKTLGSSTADTLRPGRSTSQLAPAIAARACFPVSCISSCPAFWTSPPRCFIPPRRDNAPRRILLSKMSTRNTTQTRLSPPRPTHTFPRGPFRSKATPGPSSPIPKPISSSTFTCTPAHFYFAATPTRTPITRHLPSGAPPHLRCFLDLTYLFLYPSNYFFLPFLSPFLLHPLFVSIRCIATAAMTMTTTT